MQNTAAFFLNIQHPGFPKRSHVRSLTSATPENDWTSVCVASDGSYGIEKGLITGFPIRTHGQHWEIVQGLTHNDFALARIKATITELQEERDAVKELIPS